MKRLSWISAVLGAIILGSSVFVETQIVPLVGAILLSSGLLYATLQNAQAGSASLLKPERVAHRRKKIQS
ncbi:hypothetical protein [Erythrobacter ani]|uniref:Uncharacterized protein n=1 Tax=Erythrobacter ani TaxID=2827235 RepID=A0ABS6SJ94_9SPHN|nr:hypothetical protein [Erythrobacter ani]MBV7265078.1 hypothetical protein [Erythrobacter ani]